MAAIKDPGRAAVAARHGDAGADRPPGWGRMTLQRATSGGDDSGTERPQLRRSRTARVSSGYAVHGRGQCDDHSACGTSGLSGREGLVGAGHPAHARPASAGGHRDGRRGRHADADHGGADHVVGPRWCHAHRNMHFLDVQGTATRSHLRATTRPLLRARARAPPSAASSPYPRSSARPACA